ncbi:hypothetical protein MJO28_007039 [Puccinia striiformis f. sp. tritici]|uniref:Uncharacterized protein n=1 Tax=Puccinia striiformis f. sp. tritici TaxID=168172 RepID=A0ACC0EE95_9BASI|nr:hypothetical protein MJO28_007039 [Puccinia striiformis f. sp. tritici]
MANYQSTNPEPPPDWMLDGFDPNSVKVADLRSILLENNIPHSYTKKADLVQLYERQVRPMTAKLLKAHLSVKPSAVGIFDMRTNRYITEDTPSVSRTPRKKASSTISIDQESTASTASKPRTRRSTARTGSEREQSVIEPDGELTPQVKATTRGRTTSNRRNQRESTQPDSSPEKPARRLGKRKASEPPPGPSDAELTSEVDQLATYSISEQDELSNSSEQLRSSSSGSPVPVKKRRSELPTQSIELQEPAISKKNITKTKNRRSTLHEALESGEGTFTDFNPFQSGSNNESGGSSSKKPRPSKRQSSVKRSSIAPSQLPKSSTTPNIFNSASPNKPNPASQQVPMPPQVSPSSYAAPSSSSFIPKSTTTANVYSLHQTPARESARKSGPFPSTNRRLTMTQFQDDFDGNNSFDFGNPEQIQELLAPEESQTTSGKVLARSRRTTLQHQELSGDQVPYHQQTIPTPAHSRRHSQVPTPRTPYIQQPHNRSLSNQQYQTPLPRPHIQRIKLDELVQNTPIEKRLKITKPFRRTIPKRNGLFAGPSQLISFLLRLGCLGLMLTGVNWYLNQVDRLGYCDTGMKSNGYTRDRRIDSFLDPFHKDDDSSDDLQSFSDTLRIKFNQIWDTANRIGLLPDCQTCPTHGICDKGKLVKCELDFVRSHSDLEQNINHWFPMFMGPKCLPDTLKLVKILETSNQVYHILKKHRGQVVCSSGISGLDVDLQDGLSTIKVYGLQENLVKDLVLSSDNLDDQSSPSSSSSADEEIFELALKDLEKSKQILRSSSLMGEERWLSTFDSDQLDMNFTCRIKLGLFKIIKKFKSILISIFLVFLAWVYGSLKIKKYRQEKIKVRELVDLALIKLRDESWIHHTNPSLSPNPPRLASAQLRDLILSYDHDPLNRQKLWKKVEKIVEGNSNVRTKVDEVRGQSCKVWEWIGSYKGDLNLQSRAQFNSAASSTTAGFNSGTPQSINDDLLTSTSTPS